MSTPRIVLVSAVAALALLAPGIAAADDSLSMAVGLYGDHKARKVGDLLTVTIVEETSVRKDAQQSTDKSMDFSGSLTAFRPRIDTRGTAWTNISIPPWKLEATRSFAGKGSMENKDELNAAITVRVTEVLPNGNLLVEGKRTVVVRNDTVQFVLTGTVRPEDIDRQNTVKSTSIADAAIRYETTGSIASTQKKGLVPSFLDWINPF